MIDPLVALAVLVLVCGAYAFGEWVGTARERERRRG
jgi:hypothetical protein